jgi:hypothetical protein
MACTKLKNSNWKKGFDQKLDVGNLKIPFNYFDCGEYFFDGIFDCVKFSEGISIYHKNFKFLNSNFEFPINSFYNNIIINENEILEDVLKNSDSSITDQLSEKKKIEPVWFESYKKEMRLDNKWIKSYILKKEAIFVILDNESNIIRILNNPNIPEEVKNQLKKMFSLSDSYSNNIYISNNLKFKIKELHKNEKISNFSFLYWFFPVFKKENYAGFVLNNFKTDSFDSKFMFYNPFKYLERDLNSNLDWQFFDYSKVPSETKKLLEQMKLYKSININTESGDLFEHSIWTLLFAEKLLEVKNSKFIFKDEKTENFLKKKIIAISFLLNVGKIDPENNLVMKKRKKDFIYFKLPDNKKAGIEYINGKKKIPFLNSETLNFESFIDMSKILNEFDISSDITIISYLINNFLQLQKWLFNWKETEAEVDELLTLLKEKTIDNNDYLYALLIVSLADLLARESYKSFENEEKNISSFFFPFISNVPKKYRGTIFKPEELKKYNSFYQIFFKKIFKKELELEFQEKQLIKEKQIQEKQLQEKQLQEKKLLDIEEIKLLEKKLQEIDDKKLLEKERFQKKIKEIEEKELLEKKLKEIEEKEFLEKKLKEIEEKEILEKKLKEIEEIEEKEILEKKLKEKKLKEIREKQLLRKKEFLERKLQEKKTVATTFAFSKNINDSDSYKKIDKRIEEFNVLIKIFDNLTSNNESLCVSGNYTNFRDYLSNIEIVGKGTFGVVYKAKFKSTTKDFDEFIVKEALIEYDQEVYSKKQYKNKIKNYFNPENIFLEAIRTEILEKKLCPNFTFFYNVTKCDSCVVQRLFDKRIQNGRCYVTFMEAASSDFSDKAVTTLDSQKSMLYQLLIGFHYLHSVLSILHRDFKPANILIKNVKPGGYFKYIIGEDVFFVKNEGILVFISDFGVSLCVNPDKINLKMKRFTGSRLAEVVYNGLKPKFKLFRSLTPWYDNNILVTNFSDEKIDLNQPNRFPAFEFYEDIQDVLKLFVGGKHSVQGFIFTKMSNLNKNLEILIKKNIYGKIPNDVNYVKLVLAIEMLKELYEPPSRINFIIDKFGV